MRFAWSLLGILGSLMQNSPNRSQVAFRRGSRIRFIGRGFISPRRGTSIHHSAGSGPLPRRAGRWVRSLLTKFSGSFERSQNGPKPRAAARRSRGQALATLFRRSPTTAKNWLRRCNRSRLSGSSDSANDCCANPVFKKSPSLADPATAASTVSACFRSTPSSVSKFSFSARSTLGSVTPSHVRDFRGAMTGRADKGIIITTGSFTSEPRKEAVRDAPPIELVDGEKLTGMLEKLELGLRPRQTFEVDAPFFEEYKK